MCAGLLLRLFVYWYEMDVIDEEVLLQWREDPSDRYPGKGKALFQVHGHVYTSIKVHDLVYYRSTSGSCYWLKQMKRMTLVMMTEPT